MYLSVGQPYPDSTILALRLFYMAQQFAVIPYQASRSGHLSAQGI